ncbi:TetR/AcrR family transcriptional regulator [Kiloniella laminariae]|uniref:TetR/AcrR family transcriptional regulator n=1 Tax=Kiloniella laminariae TaxID=454162 RepID=A0ABT4LHP8_9PROT|nr:TetR/AcrR family transcriptional regulator [Kiloniella laminariae]MCZ4280630.1 TetR/AcrR family transcriptional regulator [Kiloniella laminariae]
MSAEKRHLREQEILDQTLLMIEEDGFFTLKISDLAKRCGVSIGTIYSHFSCKEDLLLGLEIRETRKAFKLVREATALGTNAIEKFVLADISCSSLLQEQPTFAEIELLVKAPSIWKRASPQVYEMMEILFRQFAEFFDQLLEAVAKELQGEQDLVHLTRVLGIGTWSLNFGLQAIAISSYSKDEQAPKLPSHWAGIHHANLNCFLKGCGWQEADGEAFIARLSGRLAEYRKSQNPH